MHIFVSNYGSFIGKHSERLQVKENGKLVLEVPFFDIEQITVENTASSLSAAAIKECIDHGIPINFLTGTGEPYAQLISPNLIGTVLTRREQLLAFYDQRGVILAKAFVEGKIKNQLAVLKYFAKYRKAADRELFDEINGSIEKIETIKQELNDIKGANVDEIRGTLLSTEGRAANRYWQVVEKLIKAKIEFAGREHRGAADPVNSLLNYGYAILKNQIQGAIIYAGLDPFGGYLHVDRSGRPSLVLDLIEEFRQQVVDRTVVAMLNRGMAIEMEEGMLAKSAKEQVRVKILERLDSTERCQSKKLKIKSIIQKQARQIASFLRGEGTYKPFVGGW